MRAAIACLLGLTLLAGGCDRPKPADGQGNAGVSADAPAPAAGTVDRSHAGEAAPDFPLALPDGTSRTLADFRGKPVLVNLWATWCAPCIAEMPALDRLAKDRAGTLHLLAIAQDIGGADKVLPFLKDRHITTLQPWLDPDMRWSASFGANLPVSILYDAQGKEVWRVAGPMDWSSDTAAKLLGAAG